MILILHLISLLYILELHLLNYDCSYKGGKNHLKSHVSERVKIGFEIATLKHVFRGV